MMKKSILLLAVVGVTAFSACHNSGSKSLKTESDSLAYAIGTDFGMSLKNVDTTIDVNVLANAIRDALKNKPGMTPEASQAFIREYFMVRKPAKTKKESEDFIANVVKNNKNAVQTSSGLVYEVIEEGGAKATQNGDTVVVHYTGTFPNGTKFDSSHDRNQPATFPLSNVIPGWTEGMKLVGKGGKIKLWIPSDLAYGEQGNYGIAPNQALVFDVEILDVKPAVAADSTARK